MILKTLDLSNTVSEKIIQYKYEIEIKNKTWFHAANLELQLEYGQEVQPSSVMA